MSEQLYSIKETTLTDIGDALRRRHGETRVGTMHGHRIVETVAPGEEIRDTYVTLNTSTEKFKCKLVDGDCSSLTIRYINKSYSLTNIIFDENNEYYSYSNLPASKDLYLHIKNNSSESCEVVLNLFELDADGNDISPLTEVEVANTYNPLDMADAIDAIESGANIPEEAFVFSGDCSYKFANNGWNWFIERYGDKITTKGITETAYMFHVSDITEIPFDININNNNHRSMSSMFSSCGKLTSIGKIINAYPNNMGQMFQFCNYIRYLPEFENLNLSRMQTYQYASYGSMFGNCYSLREIPEEFLKQLWGTQTSSSYLVLGAINSCYVLDEIRGLNPKTGILTSNAFNNAFNNCNRVKDIIFATQEDGTPYTVSWKSQTIDLGAIKYIGYASYISYITNYNSGITEDKRVIANSLNPNYDSLKNDKDWWTADIRYSRYNKTSAVNTINSLPDTSAYLATAGGTNTIKFAAEQGGLTDGGAINTMTEAEIAVATAKGWTVSFG